MKKYLNLGCGGRFHDSWTNADLNPACADVIPLNALDSMPFEDSAFSVIYASHVLEHIPKNQTAPLLGECRRILQENGIIRIVVPDLEQTALNYLACLKQALDNPGDSRSKENYEWAMLELYDQCVRTNTGGELLSYLSRKTLVNEEDIYARGGAETKNQRMRLSGNPDCPPKNQKGTVRLTSRLLKIFSRNFYKNFILRLLLHFNMPGEAGAALKQVFFRLSGEAHQWMYDRYSLAGLLQEAGFRNIVRQSFTSSAIQDWQRFNLDKEPDGSEWKPYSLYMEASK